MRLYINRSHSFIGFDRKVSITSGDERRIASANDSRVHLIFKVPLRNNKQLKMSPHSGANTAGDPMVIGSLFVQKCVLSSNTLTVQLSVKCELYCVINIYFYRVCGLYISMITLTVRAFYLTIQQAKQLICMSRPILKQNSCM